MALNRIQTEGIEDDAITTAKILDGTVGPADIADGALTNTQINASAAIVTSKLSGAVTSIASHGLGTAATLAVGTSATNVVQLDGSGNLPALNASALTNLDATDLSGTLPALNASALTNLDATDLSGTLPALNASALTNLDATDLSGNLPALNGSALTNLTSANLTGALPALNASALTNLDASDLTGALPAISGANLTGVATDTTVIEANMALLAFKVQVAGNLAKFNLVDQVIDEYKDATGVTFSTSGLTGTTATDGYISSVTYSTGSQTQIAQGTGTAIGDMTAEGGLAAGFDGNTNQAQNTIPTATGNVNNSYIGKDWGSSVTKTISGVKVWSSNNSGYNKSAGSDYSLFLLGHTSNNPAAATNLGTIVSPTTDDWSLHANSKLSGLTTSTAYRYHWVRLTQTTSVISHIGEVEFYENPVTTSTSATGTATSTANTALSAPTTGDIVLLMENASGTATLNTDIKAYVSRNGGSGWDQATLVDKGSWGTNKKILVANNVAFSNSASGTDMRYKIEWANQASGSKETRVHATSLAWA